MNQKPEPKSTVVVVRKTSDDKTLATSERGVHPLSALFPEIESSPKSVQDAFLSMFCLIMSTQRHCLSEDIWSLSYRRAAAESEKMGVDPEAFNEFVKKLEKVRQVNFRSNPLSCMF